MTNKEKVLTIRTLRLYKKKELDVVIEHDKPSTNIMHIQYLFVIFLITLDVILSQAATGPSEDEVVEKFEEIKATKEFQKAKEKVIESLSDRIDKYVLDHFRKNQ
ncbi:unnamed protein product [Schistosoma guineensis]|nr:unnamed protein product [Schistosoma guineensis]